MEKWIIRNVNIIDGTKDKAYKGEVLVVDGVIKTISKTGLDSVIEEADARIIDGQDQVLSPGFIDTHSHSDLAIILDDLLKPKIRQGITTEVLGQDGISMAPLPKEHIFDWQRNIAGLDGYSEKINWDYESVENYLKLIEDSEPTSNYSYLLPHGNIRLEVMGFTDDDPTDLQLEEMKNLVREGMELGCLGLSSGLIYIPCAYAKINELIELCKVVKEYDGVFVVHQRSEANHILKSMDEIIRIGKESGVKIHFSHFKICGKRNWKLLDKVLNKLDQAKSQGIEVSFDMYPYTAGSTMLSAILPPWMHIGGTYDMLKRLGDYAIRRILNKELKRHRTTWDNFISFAGTGGIYITSVASEENQSVVGMSLDELGRSRKQKPLEAAYDLLEEERNEVGMIDYYGYEEHLKKFVLREEMNGCTDGLLGGKPHPRAYGAFPRFISEYVRKEPLLTLEDMIYKLTGKPAKVFNIDKRGLIKEGYYADLILFDPKEFMDKGTYLDPVHHPNGLGMVMVNGHIVFKDNEYNIGFFGQMV